MVKKNYKKCVVKKMDMLLARIAEGLFVDTLLGANKLMAVEARFDIKWLEIRATD